VAGPRRPGGPEAPYAPYAPDTSQAALLKLTFTRVGDTIYGKVIDAPAPTILVLERLRQ
jgi:hypothetical protein